MNSIKTRILINVGVILLVVCVGLGAISYLTSAKALKDETLETIPQFAVQGAEVVNERISSVLGSLDVVANMEIIQV